MKLYRAITFLLLSIPYIAIANAHPIDQAMQDCLNKKNMTTAGMANCTHQATQKWDQEIENIYQKLLAHLNKQSADELKKSHKAWLNYRKIELSTIDTIYSNKRGTMYIPMRANTILSISKNRAVALQSYASTAGM